MRHTNMFRYKIINYLVVQESLELLDHLVFLGFLAVQEAPCFLGQRILSQRHQVDLKKNVMKNSYVKNKQNKTRQ